MKKDVLKFGTRRSILALAQSNWVAREVERLNPGLKTQLVGIETQGDRIQDVPLRSVEGKEFFVAELDQALKAGEVDFTIHSMKDLSLHRPEGFVSAAVPQRANPRDVILFGPGVIERLKDGKELKIGTSSPRRIENIPGFLKQALPCFHQEKGKTKQPETCFVEIRGNINTRLSRVHEDPSSARFLDGVVLAFAGLIRVWADPVGRPELQKLLEGVRWMVLPLPECPAAPAQGALAVECRKDDLQVREALAKLHDPETARHVEAERLLLAETGGGCHQRFGATSLQHPELGDILWVGGARLDGAPWNEIRWQKPQLGSNEKVRAWDGGYWRSQAGGLDSTLSVDSKKWKEKTVFLAHSRALPQSSEESLTGSRVWVSGVQSWFQMAGRGVWVEGCAEGLGFEFLENTLKEPVLRLPSLDQWRILTHSDATYEWKNLGIPAISTYDVNLIYGEEAKQRLKEATHVFWSSGSQLNGLREWMPNHAHHACGPGKTISRLREEGFSPTVFPTIKEWRKWIRIQEQ